LVWTATFVDGPMQDFAPRTFVASAVYNDLWYFPWPGHPGDWAYLGPAAPEAAWAGQVHYRRKDHIVNEERNPVITYEVAAHERPEHVVHEHEELRASAREQVLAAIRETPNIRVREVAEKLGVANPTRLYRVVRQLQTEGLIVRDGPRLSAA
jgi:hypothetical protein